MKENKYRRRHSWLVSLIAQRVPERRLQTEKNLQQQQPGALGGTSDATRDTTPMYLVKTKERKTKE